MSVPADALSFQEKGRPPMRLTTINGKWSLYLPEHRADRAEWATGWEVERLDSIEGLLRRGDVMYDIGSEEGDLPGLWALWGADVVLVEPNRRVWPNMRAIWEANALPGPVATFVGFAGDEQRDGDEPRPLTVGGWPECASGPLIGDHGFCNLWERPDIAATTIDELAERTGRPPTAVTVDVEGSELRVLRGAERVLAEQRPAVWVSVHPQFMLDMYGDLASTLHRHMADRGYVPELLAVDHEEHWLFTHPDGRRP